KLFTKESIPCEELNSFCYLIANVISAVQATSPFTVAVPLPLPTEPFIRIISTSNCNLSPGATSRLKRHLSSHAKKQILHLFSSISSTEIAPTCEIGRAHV